MRISKKAQVSTLVKLAAVAVLIAILLYLTYAYVWGTAKSVEEGLEKKAEEMFEGGADFGSSLFLGNNLYISSLITLSLWGKMRKKRLMG